MYRKIEIEDEEGKTGTITIYPGEKDKMILDLDDLPLTVDSLSRIDHLVSILSTFMSGNTICKVEATEVPEEGDGDE